MRHYSTGRRRAPRHLFAAPGLGREYLARRLIAAAIPVFALGACGGPAPPAKPVPKLTDGCYYGEGKPVLKIAGSRGTLIVPSDVKQFRVEAGENEQAPQALFTPGFLFDLGNGPEYPGTPIIAEQFGPETRSYAMQPGSIPTIRMQWAAYGEWDLVRGAPC